MKLKHHIAAAALALAMACPDTEAQSQCHKGWPGHDDISDLKGCFANPPKGYGNVPFYWWTGDPLDIDRLSEQLEILSDASTDGLCVSYNHTHATVDYEINAKGHGYCGRVSGGEPRVMSDEWWNIWKEFSTKCGQKGIGLGMDDYVVAWPGNGEFIDTIRALPGIRDYQGRLREVKVAAKAPVPQHMLMKAAADKDSVTYICTVASPELHPAFGREIIARYFQPFVEHMDEEALKGMNYFFQDELQYDLTLQSWSEDMREEFMRRKGYDIVPELPCLFVTDPDKVDERTAKVRLDYAEVLTQLAEERYFKPIYDWNAEKGLIYGCDQEGRGLRPLQYLDYFRAVSWFTAPGNDAPSRGSSFRQTKVSSSIAHLYGRPRTWLEAFHSMGWDANGALLRTQLDHHIIAGGNLLCMHGLYYSTHGGWWEWAPPCFHFRMPYWEHMKLWLRYAERMCFLLSQGTHVCDVAIMYPTETMQAVPGTNPNSMFAASETLSAHGIDYDFIDYQSLQRADTEGGMLKAAGETYRILVLTDTRAMHEETLAKIREFRRQGGIVLTMGYEMPQIAQAGSVNVQDPDALVDAIHSRIDTDFRTGKGVGKVLHRRIGARDVYMVMDVQQGDMMYFRSRGMAEVWDAMNGSTTPLAVAECTQDGSWIRYEGETGGSMLVVFSPGEPVKATAGRQQAKLSEQAVTGEWDITVIPTMNNRWGDFRLPAEDEMIGPEAREMRYFTDIASVNWSSMPCDSYGYGPYMLTLDVDSSMSLEQVLATMDSAKGWRPYVWSWQYGVPDSPGSQGWHGLKCRVEDRFLILDKGAHQIFKTQVLVPESGRYRICVEGQAPARIMIDGSEVKAGTTRLGKGWHKLVIAYADTRRTAYTLEGMRSRTVDPRDRSMVMIYPASAREPQKRGMYGDIVASRWYGTEHLIYDIYGGDKSWKYQFETAPGTTQMSFDTHGEVDRIYIDGTEAAFGCEDGRYSVQLPEHHSGISTVTIEAHPQTGYPGPAFFAGPVRMKCEGGRIPEGDWTQFGALGFYSGGMRYAKEVRIDSKGAGVTLDLGEVDATCEVSINGQKVKVLIGKPYRCDITDFVHEGDNLIEVTVYSSLSNHYRTTPSPYRGTAHAGLIGPVKIIKAE